MSDYISRADAIDAVAQEWLSEASAESPYVNDDDIDRYRELAEELFADIPSAEPNCENCKHYEPKYDVCHAPELVKQVTSKLKNPCDSLLKDDSAECKEQKSKLESADDTFCKSQLITCNRVKECNGVCPFEDALKHADQEQSLNEQNNEHDREWIIGCIKHDGFIKTDRFDKANQIILEALSADAVQNWRIGKPTEQGKYMVTLDSFGHKHIDLFYYGKPLMPNRKVKGKCWYRSDDEWGDVVYDDTDILAWQPLPKPYREDGEL